MVILLMGVTHKILPHYTYDDYLLWEGSWELMDGFPIAMSPSPLPTHQRISASLILTFGIGLKDCKNCRVYSPIDYKISEDTILCPDVLILCSKIKKSFLDFPPVLVIEILSPATALRDRHTKFEIYEQQNVKYYLIVDPDANKIEIYEIENKKYKPVDLLDNSFSFSFDRDCSATIDFGSIL